MKWFSGSIADAVSASKATNSIFVVYIEGQDELSKNMSSCMDANLISDQLNSNKFVCIKLAKDSESHKQFTEIYKIVPVPCLFFIGENGIPLEIIAGDNNIDNLNKKIISAVSKIKGTPIKVEESSASSSKNSSMETVPVKNEFGSGSTTNPTSLSSASSLSVNELKNEANGKDKEAAVEKVQQLIKKQREENTKLEEQKEKERELARRKMGKEIAQAKKLQQDKELEQMRKDREKERKLEAEARQRVLRQIEEDKANRAARMASAMSSQCDQSPTSPNNTSQPRQSFQSCDANEGRIQFKLPDGQTRNQTFPATTTLRELRMFIDDNITIPFNEYMLATTYPRREYTNRDLNSTLSDLHLLPSSVILILPVKGDTTLMRGPGWRATLSALFWSLVQPAFDFGSYLRSLITGSRRNNNTTGENRSNTSNNSQLETSETVHEQPQSRSPYYQNLGGEKSVRKRGNVHTLSDGNDSNDENNTWNGNSTQLM